MMYYNWRAKEVTEATGTIAKSGIIKYTFLDPVCDVRAAIVFTE